MGVGESDPKVQTEAIEMGRGMVDKWGMELPDLMQFFWEYCESDILTLRGVREFIADVATARASSEELEEAIQPFSLLHNVCANRRVTLEIVEAILEFRPDAASMTQDKYVETRRGFEAIGSSYPLHAACWNPSCPLSVIKLLAARNPRALGELGLFGTGLISNDDFICKYGQGTPLHYYLQRKSNLTVEGVKFLVDACPESMRILDEAKRLTPLHVLALNPKLSKHLEVLLMLIRFDPSMLQMRDSYMGETGNNPIHYACCNGDATLDTMTCLVGNWPDSIRAPNWEDCLPLHCICQNSKLDDAIALDIMMFLVHQDPTTVREGHSQGNLPIHFAAGEGRRNRQFCEFLLSHFPESVRVNNFMNHLPFQEACSAGRPETVKYLYELHPESLSLRSSGGFSPVHETIFNKVNRAEVFDFLRSLDPDCLSKEVDNGRAHDERPRFNGNLPLHMMLILGPKQEAGVKYLFDQYPESILKVDANGNGPLAIARDEDAMRRTYCSETQSEPVSFIENQTVYAIRASSVDETTTLDEDGRLLLHRAVCDSEASLGAIKLLVKAYPNAVSARDKKGLLPAHLACLRSTPDIVQYLVEIHPDALGIRDAAGGNLLHHACQCGNFGAVKYILDKCLPLVSSENIYGELPIHLLCDRSGKDETILKSAEYTEAIWRLLLACPETVARVSNGRLPTVAKTANHKRKRGESG